MPGRGERIAALVGSIAILAEPSAGAARLETPAPAQPAQQRAPACHTGELPGGADYAIGAHESWSPSSGELFVLLHGYAFGDRDAEVPEIAAELIQVSHDVAVAVIDYRKPGLAVKQGVADVEELLTLFVEDPHGCGYGRPARTWLLGASEGGIIATLAAERQALRPDPRVDGALAACGPIGDFRLQLDYIVDFRVVFNVLFPEVVPGSAIAIPPEVEAEWGTVYVPRLLELIRTRTAEVERALNLAGAAYVPGDLASIETTVMTLLGYSVRATNDAVRTLGGSPLDNLARVYSGSGDPALDAHVDAHAERFAADPAALAEIETFYQTSGRLDLRPQGGSRVPVVTLHTTQDPLVPFEHERRYAVKVQLAGSADDHSGLTVERFGHCAFETEEVLRAFMTLRLLH